MYTFHLEAVVPDASAAKHPVDKMEQVLKEVKDAGEAHLHEGTAGHVCLCPAKHCHPDCTLTSVTVSNRTTAL